MMTYHTKVFEISEILYLYEFKCSLDYSHLLQHYNHTDAEGGFNNL